MAARKTAASPRRPALKVPDAVTLLKQDHREVSELLEKFESASDAGKRSIAERICKALTLHAQIEEEIFYPAARNVLDAKDLDLVDEADVEHASLKGLIARIERSAPSDDHYEALVAVLGEYVKHHVKEEEHELFPKIRKADLDLQVLGEQLAQRKSALTGTPPPGAAQH